MVSYINILITINTHIFREYYLMNIYVGNLAYSITNDELRDTFAEFGEVTTANIIIDKFSDQSKGFGFVEMSNDDDAQEAIESLNGSLLKGRNIKVNEARPRNERPARKPRY